MTTFEEQLGYVLARALAAYRANIKMAHMGFEEVAGYVFNGVIQLTMDLAAAETPQKTLFIMAVYEEYEKVLPRVFLNLTEITSIIDYAAMQAKESEMERVLEAVEKIINRIQNEKL